MVNYLLLNFALAFVRTQNILRHGQIFLEHKVLREAKVPNLVIEQINNHVLTT